MRKAPNTRDAKKDARAAFNELIQMPGWSAGLPPRIVRREHAEGHYIDLREVNRRTTSGWEKAKLLSKTLGPQEEKRKKKQKEVDQALVRD